MEAFKVQSVRRNYLNKKGISRTQPGCVIAMWVYSDAEAERSPQGPHSQEETQVRKAPCGWSDATHAQRQRRRPFG